VLIGWSVAELKNEQLGGVASVVDRLLKAEDAFGFDTSRRVGVWQPTAREFNRIRSAAEFQDRALLRKPIWESVSRSTRSARQCEEEAASRKTTAYGAARRESLDAIARARELGFQSGQVAKRLEAFNRSFDANVVDAIIRDAMSAIHSVDRALLLAASELMGRWHTSSSLVRSTQDGVSGRHHPPEEALHPEELKERLRARANSSSGGRTMNKRSDNLLDMEHGVGGPRFRWKLAHRRAASTSRCRQTDQQIQQASDYLRMCREIGRASADRAYPTLTAACALVENEQSSRALKLSILGSLPRAEVAAPVGAKQHVIDAAEALFFDIRGQSRASGWMNCHIFVPEAKFGSKELAAKLKLAHFGGPVVARALLDGQEKLPLEEAQQIIDQELQLHAKLQAALEFDLDAQSAERYLKVYLDYDLQRKKLQFEREKFHVDSPSAG
jgi:hypothetical protein